jgi:aspartyl-tRNA(Asn)/glutamyl-tRNA(Gln) amidotransferase subunit C
MAKDKTPVVSPQDVRHVAMLARLGVDDARVAALTTDLNTILEHMDALSHVNTDAVAEYTASEQGMRLREDQGPAIPLAAKPESFAPEMRADLFLVPRLSTHEDAEPGA